jgi:hypothetical protein
VNAPLCAKDRICAWYELGRRRAYKTTYRSARQAVARALLGPARTASASVLSNHAACTHTSPSHRTLARAPRRSPTRRHHRRRGEHVRCALRAEICDPCVVPRGMYRSPVSFGARRSRVFGARAATPKSRSAAGGGRRRWRCRRRTRCEDAPMSVAASDDGGAAEAEARQR